MSHVKNYRLQLLIAMAALLLVTLACSIQIPRVGILPVGPVESSVEIRMGAGTLKLDGGAEGLVEGEIKYNITDWKPEVLAQDDEVTIKQSADVPGLTIPKDLVNQWDLKLGSSPIRLAVHAGAYDGTLELGGVPLKALSIKDGASNSKVTFDTPNPELMESFLYETGASNVEIIGLGNANVSEMVLRMGAGSYTLDFSGEIQRPMTVQVKGGVSNTRIIIPVSTSCVIDVQGGVSNVSPTGTWTIEGSSYKTSGNTPLVHIQVEQGVGNLTLVQE
jgi:hypothetical protein